MKTNAWVALLFGVAPTLSLIPGCAIDGSNDAETDEAQEELSTAPDARTIAPSKLGTRFITCPVRNTQKAASATFRGKAYAYKTDAEMDPTSPGWESRATFDDHALDGLVPADASAMLIDIRRVNGKPAYAYYGANGNRHTTYEPWSSAKFMAASAAMSRVRSSSSLGVGGRSTVGGSAVGDLVTAMEAYRSSGNVSASSNALAGYFLTVAGARYTNGLLQGNWLNLAGDGSQFHVSTNPGAPAAHGARNPSRRARASGATRRARRSPRPPTRPWSTTSRSPRSRRPNG